MRTVLSTIVSGPALDIGKLQALVVFWPVQFGPYRGGASRPFVSLERAETFAVRVRKTGRQAEVHRIIDGTGHGKDT